MCHMICMCQARDQRKAMLWNNIEAIFMCTGVGTAETGRVCTRAASDAAPGATTRYSRVVRQCHLQRPAQLAESAQCEKQVSVTITVSSILYSLFTIYTLPTNSARFTYGVGYQGVSSAARDALVFPLEGARHTHARQATTRCILIQMSVNISYFENKIQYEL